MNTILCLDQATKITGYSVWQTDPPQLIAQGKFSYEEEPNLAQRLHAIKLHVLALVLKYKVSKLYLEDIQYQQQAGVTTYKVLAELIGVLQELAVEQTIPCELVHSQSWKSTCGVRGRARAEQKASAQKHVREVYGLNVSQDIADAICIGEHVTRSQECAW